MTKPVDVEQIRATLNKPTGKVCKADLIACAVPLLTLVDRQAADLKEVVKNHMEESEHRHRLQIEIRNRIAENVRLTKLLTTGYDLVAESIAETKQYDFAARARSHVAKAMTALKEQDNE